MTQGDIVVRGASGEGILPDRLQAGAARAVDELALAVGNLVDQALDRVLLTGEPVRSAAEGRGLLEGTADVEDVADTIQKLVVVAVPIVRTVARGARFTRVPWVMVTSTALSLGIAVRTGVRELQVIAGLVSHRIQQHTGAPADTALVKRLAVDLYLDARKQPDPTVSSGRMGRVARRWVLSGAFARDTSGRARKALAAAEALDIDAALDRWALRPRG